MTVEPALERLAATIKARRAATADKSYTRQLLDAGPEKCAKKFGEEAIEAALAAVQPGTDRLTAEAADVLYHLLVLLESRGIALGDVLKILEARSNMSGLDEKALRSK